MINQIIYQKVGEWEKRGSRKKMLDKIERWLLQFEDDEKSEMLSLLSHFDYYSQNNLSIAVVDLYNKFKKECPDEEVVFSKVEKDIGTSYSNILFTEFWLKNNLYDYTQDSLSNIISENDIKNIVIVDDYFGSGKTIIKYLTKLLQLSDQLKDRNIFILVLEGSFVGKQAIEKFAKDNQLNITIVANKYSKKAFDSDNVYSLTEVDFHRTKYSDIYDKRINNNEYKFGYGEIEALVSFYYNTPNNTLGLFWQNVCGFHGLFERHKKENTTLTSMRKRIRQQNNLKQFEIIKNVDNYKIDIFMVYFLAKQRNFSVYEACVDFGLTEKQINEILSYMLSKDYLKFENGNYFATETMKKKIYSTRINMFKTQFENSSKNKIKRTDIDYIPKNFKDKFSGYKND